MRCALLILAILLGASGAHAAEPLPAGFAPGPVWLSTTLPVHGDAVEAYTVVYDSSAEPIEGAVTFLMDGEPIGSSPFALEAGETEVRSVRWTAVEGEHVLSARIDTAYHQETKEAALLATRTTASTTITVAAPPPPPEPEPTAAVSTQDSRGSAPALIDTLTKAPIVGSAVGAAIKAAETWRAAGEDTLRTYADRFATSTEAIVPAAAPEGEVLGTSTAATLPSGSPLGASVAEAALPVFIYPIFFYPLFLILLGLLLIFLSKKLNSPGRRRKR